MRRRGFLAGLGASALAPGAARAATPDIRHLVVILRENHSFDSYFGAFPGANGAEAGPVCSDTPHDPPHSRGAALSGPVSMGRDADFPGNCHYTPAQIPRYQAWARRFTLCDNYFCELLAPSVPNYFGLMGVAAPVLANPHGHLRGMFQETSLLDRLDARGIDWRNYDGGIPLVSMFRRAAGSGKVVPLERLQEDAARGVLPPMTWVTPSIADSEHPPYSVARGEAWTARQVDALMAGPAWPHTAIVIVWDEWGGFADHVKPPPVEEEPTLHQRLRYGYRVPCLVLSPLARRGFVSHTLYSHASVVRTICRLFGLPPLTPADSAANDLFGCFD